MLYYINELRFVESLQNCWVLYSNASCQLYIVTGTGTALVYRHKFHVGDYVYTTHTETFKLLS